MSMSMEPTAPGPPFSCHCCRRSFSRPDHLARHVRTHTREKPYGCGKCGKVFARTDLLRRHDLQHHSDSAVPTTSSTRAAQACPRCVASKVKCSDERPCRRCAKRGLSCPSSSPSLPQQPRHVSPSRSSSNVLQSATLDVSWVPSHTPGPSTPSDGQDDYGADVYTDLLNTLFAPPSVVPAVTSSSDGGVLGSSSLPWSNNALLDFDLSAWDFSFPTVLPELSAPAALLSVGAATTNEPIPPTAESISSEGAKAFRASLWHWIPSSADTRPANEPEPSSITAFTPTVVPEMSQLHPHISAIRMGQSERDRILSIILEQCEKTSIVRIATSFPAQHVLEQLLQTALHFQTVGSPFAWIHIPTFSVQSVCNELLCALVACGAIISPAAPVQALGAAMLDMIYDSIMKKWVRNNATTRNFELAQTYALVQHLLLWAGSKRRMEFGEGVAQPLITIIRRSGMLQENHCPLESPGLEDDGSQLEVKWKTWVQKEATIRLAYQVFVNDVQTSMMLFINPLMSCSEMTLSLPSSDCLWRASTAEEWRACWLTTPLHREPRHSLSDHVRNAFHAPHGSRYSDQTAAISPSDAALLLYGLWESIWNCQRTTSWLQADHFQLQPLPLSVSVQLELLSHVLELCDPSTASADLPQMQDFEQQDLPEMQANNALLASNSLLFHYLNLMLFAPLRRITQLAGKEGEAEAHRAFRLLQEWTQAREGRRSLWHAAQVYRYARLLSSSQMRNAFVVAVYHASLALWAYGVIMGASSRQGICSLPCQNPVSSPMTGSQSRLDAEMSPKVEAFIACSANSPTLASSRGGHEELISIVSSPGASMELAIHILGPPASQSDTHDMPLFTCMVTKLMRDLAEAVQAVGLG